MADVARLLRTGLVAEFFRFGGVGVVGFAVDGALLSLLAATAGMGVYLPRLISFPAALTTTWALNRYVTFRRRRSVRAGREYGRYMGVQIVGALTNFLVYALAIALVGEPFREHVIIPFALGSAAGLLVNFVGAKFLVFVG